MIGSLVIVQGEGIAAMAFGLLMFTVLLSAAAAGLSTYYLNISKERLCFLGRKSEELYIEVEALDSALCRFFEESYSLVGDAPQAPVLHSDASTVAGRHFATIKMLIGFYFPSLTTGLARALAATTTAQHALTLLEHSGQAESERALEAADCAICDVKDAFEDLKAAILREGRLFSVSASNPAALVRSQANLPTLRRIPVV
jgi:hypothetical protein